MLNCEICHIQKKHDLLGGQTNHKNDGPGETTKRRDDETMCFDAKLLQVLAELFLLGVGGFVAHGPEIKSISRVVSFLGVEKI